MDAKEVVGVVVGEARVPATLIGWRLLTEQRLGDFVRLALLRALDVRHAEDLARALASLEDVGRLLQWLLGDRAQAPELWAELAPFRAALPKARKHPLGWVPAPADAKALDETGRAR